MHRASPLITDLPAQGVSAQFQRSSWAAGAGWAPEASWTAAGGAQRGPLEGLRRESQAGQEDRTPELRDAQRGAGRM